MTRGITATSYGHMQSIGLKRRDNQKKNSTTEEKLTPDNHVGIFINIDLHTQ